MSDKTMNTIYSGSAEFGKITSIIGYIVTVILFATMLGIGIYFIVKKKEYVVPKNIKLAEPFTGQNKLKVITEDKCESLLTGFSLDNYPTCLEKSKYNDKKEVVCPDGSPMPVMTAYSNKKEGCSEFVHLTSDKTITDIGILFVLFSIFVLTISSFHLYLVLKYKPYAAYEGMSTGLDALTGVTHMLTGDIASKLRIL
jgi:hypothetical protein